MSTFSSIVILLTNSRTWSKSGCFGLDIPGDDKDDDMDEHNEGDGVSPGGTSTDSRSGRIVVRTAAADTRLGAKE